MKLLTIASCLVGLAALLCGLVGDSLLDARVRARDEADFASDLNSVLAIVEASDWNEPWESDPDWRELERRLGMDILPVRPPRDANEEESATRLRWSRSSSGKLRLTAMAQLKSSDANSPSGDPSYLRVTREVADSGLSTVWWGCWSAICLMGAMLASVAFAVQTRQQRQLDGLLEPWLAALRSNKPRSEFLPKIATPSQLESSLAIVSLRINQTIDELRDQNERSELVLRNLREGVLAVDERSHVLLANNALQQLLGLPQEPYLDRLLLEIVRVPVVNDVAQRVLSQQTPCEELLELVTPHRSLRILGRSLPLGSQRCGALITIRDETQLRRIDSIRRDFVANASHELKTPLAAIRAYAETLQLGALDDRPAAERFVGGIIEQADRIHGLVQGMLQLSRVESGTALKIEPFDAREAAEACIAAVLPMARVKGIQFDSTLPDRPLAIRSDRDGFQTIVSNLLSNAVRYTPAGGQVSIRLSEEGGECRLRVTDTGIGIRPADLERVFERFYRAEKDRSTDSGGTGLGLSIVKHLAQSLGGSVSANSQLGQGSCFEVKLPTTP